MILIFHRQPLKAIYLTYEVFATAFIRLPYWVLVSIPRSWRRRPSWSLKSAILHRALCRYRIAAGRCVQIFPSPNHLAITPGPGVHGIWIDPVPELITGDVKLYANIADVSFIRIPGYWTHKKGTTIDIGASPLRGEKIVMHLHGGAYSALSAHPSDPTSAIARGILEFAHAVQRVFSVEYRLTVPEPFEEANPFPTALIDALAGYNYLIRQVGFAPDDIIIAGDSAGGNLTLALTRYLVENQNDEAVRLPAPPNGIILISPWTEFIFTNAKITGIPPSSSIFKYWDTDYIGNPYSGTRSLTAKALAGPLGVGSLELNRYFSPASLCPLFTISFVGFPRTFLIAGEVEGLIDQIHVLRDRMIKDLGEGDGVVEGDGKVRYYEAVDGWHDYLVPAGFEPQRTETLQELARWLAL